MPAQPNQPPEPSPHNLPAIVDATRRTHLASERTQLAWWRTGLAALAVALGVGRVVPELDKTATHWPYVLTGVGFALWGILAIAYGSAQRTATSKALGEGRLPEPAPWPLRTLAFGGVGLGLLTAVLILLD
jgi:uncharacterized membrane protein YidH (DUF202 family)